jgi:hypothetical protein
MGQFPSWANAASAFPGLTACHVAIERVERNRGDGKRYTQKIQPRFFAKQADGHKTYHDAQRRDLFGVQSMLVDDELVNAEESTWQSRGPRRDVPYFQ